MGHLSLTSMNERITELETHLAFQDQQSQIDMLKEQVELLHKKLQLLSESVVHHDENESPPPHY